MDPSSNVGLKYSAGRPPLLPKRSGASGIFRRGEERPVSLLPSSVSYDRLRIWSNLERSGRRLQESMLLVTQPGRRAAQFRISPEWPHGLDAQVGIRAASLLPPL